MWQKNYCEGFVVYHLCEEQTTGEAINQIIIYALSELGLSMSYCHSQSYDGTRDIVG